MTDRKAIKEAREASLAAGMLRLKEAAAISGRSISGLKVYIAAGELKATRRGALFEIAPADLQEFMARPQKKRGRKVGSAPLKEAKPAPAPKKGPAQLPGTPVEPEGVKKTVVPAPPPRFQVVDLPTMRPPVTRRDGEEFRKWQRPGRW